MTPELSAAIARIRAGLSLHKTGGRMIVESSNLRTLLSALEEAQAVRAGWQDISTAPKDGTTIFGQNWRTAERGLVHLNVDGLWQVVDGLGNYPIGGLYFVPTHWFSLPAPPPLPLLTPTGAQE